MSEFFILIMMTRKQKEKLTGFAHKTERLNYCEFTTYVCPVRNAEARLVERAKARV